MPPSVSCAVCAAIQAEKALLKESAPSLGLSPHWCNLKFLASPFMLPLARPSRAAAGLAWCVEEQKTAPAPRALLVHAGQARGWQVKPE
jgi:hypothetical protein